MDAMKALSDENRVRALLALGRGELCLCQIIELLGLAPSTVSKHMAVLAGAGLVRTRKDGRWIYYRLADDADKPAPVCVRDAVAMTLGCLARDARARDDARRAQCIRKMDREQLCCHYHP